MTHAAAWSNTQFDFHPELMSAVCYFAERSAILTGEVLRRLADNGVGCDRAFTDRGLPAGFLLELGAVAQLAVWAQSGVAALLPKSIPGFHDAAAQLNDRVQANPHQFNDIGSAILARQLMQLWIEHFHWTAPWLLGADLVIGELDEQDAVAAVATLLRQLGSIRDK